MDPRLLQYLAALAVPDYAVLPWDQLTQSDALTGGVASAALDTEIRPNELGILMVQFTTSPGTSNIAFGPDNTVLATTASPRLASSGGTHQRVIGPLTGQSRFMSWLITNSRTMVWDVMKVTLADLPTDGL